MSETPPVKPPSPFSEDYFERGKELGISGYSAYRWLPELTLPFAHEVVTQLGIQRGERILDFGCAKGYYVVALRLLHYKAFGIDTSEYAISRAPKAVAPFLFSDMEGVFREAIKSGDFTWTIAKDVFEHLQPDALLRTLRELRNVTHNLFVIVPLGAHGRYLIPEFEKDNTHVIREGLEWWAKALTDGGFAVRSATTCMPFVKDRWAHKPLGHGFFIARRA